MAINTFVTVTVITTTGTGNPPSLSGQMIANPIATAGFANAAGSNVTLSWDSAVITTAAQLRAAVAAAMQQALSQLTGP